MEEENRKSIQAKREIVADSLQTYQLKILELQNNTEVAGELGPLKYISGLTGTPMDKIINILLLIIIFVFDPLAISFDQAYPKRRKNLYGELEEVKKKVKKPIIEDDKRMDVIGQNGNDGLHYEPEHDGYMLDNDDVWQSKETPEPVKPPNPVSKTGRQLEGNILKVIQKGPSKWRVLLKSGEIVKVDKYKVKLAINNKPDDSSNSKVY